MVAQYLFESNLVTVGYGNVIHLVAEAEYQTVLRVGPACTYAFPNGNVFLGLLVFPIADNRLMVLAETRKDMAELAVAMRALVQVHKVHIHGLPRYLSIVLRVQMQQWLA